LCLSDFHIPGHDPSKLVELRLPCGHLTVRVDIRVDAWISRYRQRPGGLLRFPRLQSCHRFSLGLHWDVRVVFQHFTADVARDDHEGLPGHACLGHSYEAGVAQASMFGGLFYHYPSTDRPPSRGETERRAASDGSVPWLRASWIARAVAPKPRARFRSEGCSRPHRRGAGRLPDQHEDGDKERREENH
jgi:hypothetical protein